MKKKVTTYSSGLPHVTGLPRSTLDQEVIIIFEDDMTFMQELLRNAYVLSKISDSDTQKLKKDFADLKKEINPRLNFIERSLLELMSENKRLKELQNQT